jgi:hypothetical protein
MYFRLQKPFTPFTVPVKLARVFFGEKKQAFDPLRGAQAVSSCTFGGPKPSTVTMPVAGGHHAPAS